MGRNNNNLGIVAVLVVLVNSNYVYKLTYTMI